MTRRCNLQKASEWRERLQRFENSSVSIVRFCESECVSVSAFYQWRKKLKQPRYQQATSQTKEISVTNPETPVFTPVRILSPATVTVQLPGGTQFHIPAGDPDTLKVAVEVLARVDSDRSGAEAC